MRKLFFFIFIPIILTSIGELNLKSTINHLHLTANLAAVPSLVFNFSVIFSIFCIIAGGLLWIIGMSKYELSFMYPFLTLNYLLIILGSVFLLHEKVSIFTYLAIFFIVTGLVIISRSKYAEKN